MIVNDEIKGNKHTSLYITTATYPDKTPRKTFGWAPWGAGATLSRIRPPAARSTAADGGGRVCLTA